MSLAILEHVQLIVKEVHKEIETKRFASRSHAIEYAIEQLRRVKS